MEFSRPIRSLSTVYTRGSPEAGREKQKGTCSLAMVTNIGKYPLYKRFTPFPENVFYLHISQKYNLSMKIYHKNEKNTRG
jgi:hypothetical protein